jgi:hypothetical protein
MRPAKQPSASPLPSNGSPPRLSQHKKCKQNVRDRQVERPVSAELDETGQPVRGVCLALSFLALVRSRSRRRSPSRNCRRSPHPAHRTRKQQRQRLGRQQSGGKRCRPPQGHVLASTTLVSPWQDILEAFVDRGQLRKLAEPTISCAVKRIPGEAVGGAREHYRRLRSSYDLSKVRAKGLKLKPFGYKPEEAVAKSI